MLQLAVYKEPLPGVADAAGPPVRMVVSGDTKMWKLGQHINSALGVSVIAAETTAGAAYSRKRHDYRWHSGQSIPGSAFLVQRPNGPAPGCVIISGEQAAPYFWMRVSELYRKDVAVAAAAVRASDGGRNEVGADADVDADVDVDVDVDVAAVAEQVLPDVHIDHHDVNVSALFRGQSNGAKLEQEPSEAAMSCFYFIKEHAGTNGVAVPTVGCQVVLEGIMPYAPPSQGCTRAGAHASMAMPRLVQLASRREVAGVGGTASASAAEVSWPNLKFWGTHTCKLNDAWRADRPTLEQLVAQQGSCDIADGNAGLLDMATPLFNVDGSDRRPTTRGSADGNGCKCAACSC